MRGTAGHECARLLKTEEVVDVVLRRGSIVVGEFGRETGQQTI